MLICVNICLENPKRRKTSRSNSRDSFSDHSHAEMNLQTGLAFLQSKKEGIDTAVFILLFKKKIVLIMI